MHTRSLTSLLIGVCLLLPAVMLAPATSHAQPADDVAPAGDASDAAPADSSAEDAPAEEASMQDASAEEASTEEAPPADAEADDAVPEEPTAASEADGDASETAEQAEPCADEEPSPEELANLPADASSWEPPTRTHDTWDWVLLVTGEWIKGEIDSVRDGEMAFDSDQFDDLTIDMDDVAAIYAYRPHVYQLESRDTLSGVGILRNGEFTIDGQTMPADQFMGMVDGQERERDYWYMKLNLSLSYRTGNTDQATLSDSLFVRRDAASNRFTLDTYGSIGNSAGALNVQNQTGTAQLDIFISKVFYVTPALLSATHDRFQNIDARIIPAAGVGFHAIDASAVTWDLEAGGGYQYSNYQGRKKGYSDAVVRLATHFDADIGDPVEITLDWNSTLVVTEMDRTFHHGDLTLELDVTDAIDTTLSVIYDRIEGPQPAEDGTRPKRDDIQVMFGVQLELG